MLSSNEPGPINLGNPEEFSVADFAQLVLKITGSASAIEYLPLPTDDPGRRRPVITRAEQLLGWKPGIPVEDGVRHTVEWFRSRPEELSASGY
jgi:dTDP-glucose 4,6-dehydratase